MSLNSPCFPEIFSDATFLSFDPPQDIHAYTHIYVYVYYPVLKEIEKNNNYSWKNNEITLGVEIMAIISFSKRMPCLSLAEFSLNHFFRSRALSINKPLLSPLQSPLQLERVFCVMIEVIGLGYPIILHDICTLSYIRLVPKSWNQILSCWIFEPYC